MSKVSRANRILSKPGCRVLQKMKSPGQMALEAFEPRILLNATLPSTWTTPSQMRSAYGFDQVSFGPVPGDGGSGPNGPIRQTVAIVAA